MTEAGRRKREADKLRLRRKRAAKKAGELQVDSARSGNGRCRWNVFCAHPVVNERFRGAFCALHERAAAYEMGLLEDEDEVVEERNFGWLPVSTDAIALMKQLQAQFDQEEEEI